MRGLNQLWRMAADALLIAVTMSLIVMVLYCASVAWA
jgi:hypothetical protein